MKKTLTTMFLWSVFYRLSGIILCPFLNAYCILLAKEKYPKWAYYLDNVEDGFDGNRWFFVDRYFKKDISGSNGFVRYAYSVWWCWRNMAFNHRYHPKCSVDITNPKDLVFEGNTYHHGIQYSFEPNKIETKWYKITATYDGVRLTSEFSFTPKEVWTFSFKKGFGTKFVWKYRRKGLKIYPNLYKDPWWLEKIQKEGWPRYKTRGVYASLRRTKDLNL